ncbi:MAG: hypothetical protein UU48_C0002G0055 [Candidatus Uhrbacteria bacterium GW2011_GWF2_41_16]|jgi:putative Holliday junction resolvase|uniref:Putative pre-16S rRNA nuclease n=2 Tax=Candidatus Uhriibacteriota TaxID=1752732 RepID=A0A0G0XNZ3_9BACT|nr:MAG: hypothetical protein UU31_C0003G0063 [Candidatus Uhrbacteria bacterium GW2011_GWA2_41_10]KKR87540.1 MAG: hypothetical protein UU35_C0002G0041 [Candidatus Uhrbacteria bacterium GW2011_GWC2_41_11]KKR98520.1 MAG: hypothetical protein UU48_C0002G0055 [Candidatus Uhrbacteria bacterium GW2011_GWF2_41_16]HBO99943.1 Holliday junction resolvase RuvX [Candidatus Uhrbacteria bacterium]
MHFLGIDYGDKKIGLALGDSEAKVAVPWEVISNRGEETISLFVKRIHEEGIDGVVVGVPLTTGSHHNEKQLEKTRFFIEKLRNVISIPLFEEDESYTTAESIRLRCEEGSGVSEDALAAMLILQQYFERKV